MSSLQFKPLLRVTKKAPKRKREQSPPRKNKSYVVNLSAEDAEKFGSIKTAGRRRSSRVQGKVYFHVMPYRQVRHL